MAFQVSPGVNVTEIDLTTIVPAVATTQAGIAGVFRWGPVGSRVLVDTEATLAARFGKPTSFNAETWFTASSFLGYGNILYVVRAANTTATNSTSGVLYSNGLPTATLSAIAGPNTAYGNTISIPASDSLNATIKNQNDYTAKANSITSNAYFVAKYPGAIGNSLRVSVCYSNTQYSNSINLVGTGTNIVNTNILSTYFSITNNSNVAQIAIGQGSAGSNSSTTAQAAAVLASITVGDYIQVGNSTIGTQFMQVANVSSVVPANSAGASASFTINFTSPFRLTGTYTTNTVSRYWEFYNVIQNAPSQSPYVAQFGNTAAQDQLHVVVEDENGLFSGVPGTVLEVFPNLSRATDAKSPDGSAIFYRTYINQVSQYVWSTNDDASAPSNTAVNVASSTRTNPYSVAFQGGTDSYDETSIADGDLINGYSLFQSTEDLDIAMIIAGKTKDGTYTVPNWIVDNITEVRHDCIAFISPRYADVVNQVGNEMNNIIAFRNNLRTTSYAVIDTGYKYMYDRYNDVYRWIPLNGDIAGLCVRTETTRDAWFSPAGFNRGQIKNIVRLAYNPRKAERDILYPAGINPVVSFPGQGTVLYGDKTMLAQPSAFDRINVRRLFIVLEKAISTAAKFTLFELNDQFTRAQFVSLVTPYLRDIKGRRGIYDFAVVCDETNNTPDIIDSNQFVGDIYIKPARSINYIQLNFVAVRTGVAFSEVIGQF